MNESIKKALDVLHNGGVICYPTDTVWGLGCDATNEKAVDKLYEIKKRNPQNSMLVLLDNSGKVPSYIEEMPDVAYDLFETATSPLTLILPGAKNLAKNLIAEDGTIGIRVVEHEFCRKLLQRFKKPIVSTSANISGEATPSIFDEIKNGILQRVDYVVGYGQDNLVKNKPSSIIKVGVGGEVEIIRP